MNIAVFIVLLVMVVAQGVHLLFSIYRGRRPEASDAALPFDPAINAGSMVIDSSSTFGKRIYVVMDEGAAAEIKAMIETGEVPAGEVVVASGFDNGG